MAKVEEKGDDDIKYNGYLFIIQLYGSIFSYERKAFIVFSLEGSDEEDLIASASC